MRGIKTFKKTINLENKVVCDADIRDALISAFRILMRDCKIHYPGQFGEKDNISFYFHEDDFRSCDRDYIVEFNFKEGVSRTELPIGVNIKNLQGLSFNDCVAYLYNMMCRYFKIDLKKVGNTLFILDDISIFDKVKNDTNNKINDRVIDELMRSFRNMEI